MARRNKIVKVCKHCGNYINDKNRVKYILSDAEDALIRYNKKIEERINEIREEK